MHIQYKIIWLFFIRWSSSPVLGSLNCRMTTKGTEFQGTIGQTESGLQCQLWKDQFPHSHGYTELSGQNNYCRNPDNSERPWCYANNTCTEREYCDIPMCSIKECLRRKDGMDYIGTRNYTISGRGCQRWDSQTPHQHWFTRLFDQNNFCRNVDGNHMPWCYTVDPTMRWDNCDIPQCAKEECKRTVNGIDYDGTKSVTENGKLCQKWKSQTPHRHNYQRLSEDENYCRNPDRSPKPWCFTSHSDTRREYCDISPCLPEKCDNNWYRFGSSCVYFFKRSPGITSREAEKICATKLGHLVTISSKPKLDFIRYMMKVVLNIKETHIGLRKRAGNGKHSDFYWTDGRPLTFTAWYKSGNISQPDGFSDESCTSMAIFGEETHTWFDIPCLLDTIPNFACEINEDTGIQGLGHVLQTHNYSMNTHNVFLCDNLEAISRLYVCNGYPDCKDNSDEVHCNYSKIFPYICDDGSSVSLAGYCDGHEDCKDGSDENRCRTKPKCSSDEWRCLDGRCVLSDKRCDGNMDCVDLSDEKDCFGDECHHLLTTCYDQKCISKARKCDKFVDCHGNYQEDERSFVCSTLPIFSCGDLIRQAKVESGKYQISLGMNSSVEVECVFSGSIAKTLVRNLQNDWISMQEEGLGSTHRVQYALSTTQIQVLKNISLCSQYIAIEVKCYSEENSYSLTFQDINGDIHYPREYSKDCLCFLGTFCTVSKPDRCQCVANTSEIDPAFWIKSHSSGRGILLDHENVPVVEIQGNSHGSALFLHISGMTCIEEIDETSSNKVCDNGDVYSESTFCRMRVNKFGDIIGCRDLSHLQNCDDVICPESYMKCNNSFCIHIGLICDGLKHCPNGEDEINCDSLKCPGYFRCYKSPNCLPSSSVCNGEQDCPYGDDERLCNVTCPEGCMCEDLVFSCTQDPIEFTSMHFDRRINRLDLSNQNISHRRFVFPHLLNLGELILKNASIVTLFPGIYKNLLNLYLLDLSNNAIATILQNVFEGLENLRFLYLEGYKGMLSISPLAFMGLTSLTQLDLSQKSLSKLPNFAFNGLDNLRCLNLSHNEITEINLALKEGLENLKILDIRYSGVSPQVSMFDSLRSLQQVYTDSYVFCCLVPDSLKRENCFPPEDEFSSCQNIMKYGVLRGFLWVIGIAALLGNLAVLITRIIMEKSDIVKKSFSLWVANLSISDLLMGIYLIIIGAVDVKFKGEYALYAEVWTSSFGCKLAGIISLLSNQASVFFILLISIDRILAVKFPFKNIHLSLRAVTVICISVWIASAALALTPLLFWSDKFYSKSGVCLALPLVKAESGDTIYSVTIFVFINFLVFLAIAIIQLLIYLEIKTVSARCGVHVSTRQRRELEIARSLLMVVLTDFCCWFPVGIMGAMAMTGYKLPPDVYVWVTVFVIPINAALNPFLYTFSSLLKRRNVPDTKTHKNTETFQLETFMKIYQSDSVYYDQADKGVSLNKYLARENATMKISNIYLIATKLITALELLHSKNITHGSVSGNNTFLTFEQGGIVRAQLNLNIDEMSDDNDTAKDIGDYGQLIRLLLKIQKNYLERM